MRKINIVTLGCAKNLVDSENLAGHLTHYGHEVVFDVDDPNTEIAIINTCGFIGDAKEESIDTIIRFIDYQKKKKTLKEVIVCGCLSERYKKELCVEIPEVKHFYGVHEWEKIAELLSSPLEGELYKRRIRSTPKHYAYLKIAEGCDRTCSFCAIPLIRGKHLSRPIESLLAEAKKLVAEGVKEIILISQDTTYYGIDLYGKRMLGVLLKQLAEESGAVWIRIHYTYPTGFPMDVLEAMKNYPSICRYIDIPFQHINTEILRSMNRGIDKESTLALIRKFRQEIPEVVLRTTLITGYPGETQEHYEELKSFIKEVRFDRLGVFSYSQEEDTPAFALGDPISQEVKQERMEELMAIQQNISHQMNEKKIGSILPVIIDRKEGDFWIGRTASDSPEIDNEVIIEGGSLHEGGMYFAKITRSEDFDLIAEIVKSID